jgi:hypothetical protein
LEDEMNEIKKGDWVYTDEEDTEHVFLCSGTGAEYLTGGDDWWFKDCCHLLEPLKPGDKLEVGDRVAVIERVIGDPKLGEIHNVLVTRYGNKDLVMIDFTVDGLLMHYPQLARLPDCAQYERRDPVESATPKEGCHVEVEVQQDPVPCPRPEWEGIWDYLGDGYRVEWKHVRFVTSRIHGTDVIDRWLPGEFWKQIEPAPNASTAGPKLERPKRHGGIKTPWDPWEI